MSLVITKLVTQSVQVNDNSRSFTSSVLYVMVYCRVHRQSLIQMRATFQFVRSVLFVCFFLPILQGFRQLPMFSYVNIANQF